MNEHKVEKELLWSLLIICMIVCAVLVGYALGKKDDGNVESRKESSNNEVMTDDSITYEKISDEELETYSMSDSIYESFNKALFLLIEQDKDIENVKEFLNNDYYNDWIIYNSIIDKMFKGYDYPTIISKKEVLDLVKEKYGYDLDLKFHDINERDSEGIIVGFKWSESDQSYSYDPEDGAFQHGGYYSGINDEYDFYNYNLFNKKIDKDDNNVYTITAKILFNNVYYMTEGLEIPEEYYLSYNDVKNTKNESYILTQEDENKLLIGQEVGEEYYKKVINYAYEQSRDNMHTYEYKLVKEDGIIRILSYKKID